MLYIKGEVVPVHVTKVYRNGVMVPLNHLDVSGQPQNRTENPRQR
jgi:hypothetical protein